RRDQHLVGVSTSTATTVAVPTVPSRSTSCTSSPGRRSRANLGPDGSASQLSLATRHGLPLVTAIPAIPPTPPCRSQGTLHASTRCCAKREESEPPRCREARLAEHGLSCPGTSSRTSPAGLPRSRRPFEKQPGTADSLRSVSRLLPTRRCATT